MQIFPPVRVTEFDHLEPGELFIYAYDDGACFGLKTEKSASSDRNSIVVLGPHFPDAPNESFILNWQPGTVVSYGRNYSILLPCDPASWFLRGSLRNPVCIAVQEQSVFVCTNGGIYPQRFLQCFVEFSTGKVIERILSNHTAYTNNWEIVIPNADFSARSLLKYQSKEYSS
jgi:hypothetical protein